MSSVDFVNSFDFAASGFTDFVMPGCKFDVYTDYSGAEVEEPIVEASSGRAFPFLNDQEISWVNSLFQPAVDQPQPKSPQPVYEPPIQGDTLFAPRTSLDLPQIQTHSFFLAAPLPSVVSIKKEVESEVDLLIQSQPPVRVRTRTPNEIRTFSVAAQMGGDWRSYGAQYVKVSLAYAAPFPNGKVEPVTKDILGGTKTIPIKDDGSLKFSNLSISESSTKHHEKEFCLHFTVIGSDGVELIHKLSDSFYAYSHKKVLQRRESLKLRDLSKTSSNIAGGEIIHAVGFPFKQSPEFEVIFRTPFGDVIATNYEFFSESVLYFKVPALPCDSSKMQGKEMKVSVMATNDGKLYSNPLDFTYYG